MPGFEIGNLKFVADVGRRVSAAATGLPAPLRSESLGNNRASRCADFWSATTDR